MGRQYAVACSTAGVLARGFAHLPMWDGTARLPIVATRLVAGSRACVRATPVKSLGDLGGRCGHENHQLSHCEGQLRLMRVASPTCGRVGPPAMVLLAVPATVLSAWVATAFHSLRVSLNFSVMARELLES